MKELKLIPITEQMTGGNKDLADALQKNFVTLQQFMTHRELTLKTSIDGIYDKLSKEMNNKFITLRNELKDDIKNEIGNYSQNIEKKLDDILTALQKGTGKK